MQVKWIEIMSEAHDYLITPKNRSYRFLMDHRHLWLHFLKNNML